MHHLPRKPWRTHPACRVATPGDAPRPERVSIRPRPTKSDVFRHFSQIYQSQIGFVSQIRGGRLLFVDAQSAQNPMRRHSKQKTYRQLFARLFFFQCTKCTNCPVHLPRKPRRTHFVFMPIIAGWRASKYSCVPRPERVSTRPRSDKIRRFPTLFANFPIANWLRSANSWWQVTFRRCTKCTVRLRHKLSAFSHQPSARRLASYRRSSAFIGGPYGFSRKSSRRAKKWRDSSTKLQCVAILNK